MLNSQRPLHKDRSDPGGLALEQFSLLRIVVDNHQDAAVEWLHFSDVRGSNLFFGERATTAGWRDLRIGTVLKIVMICR